MKKEEWRRKRRRHKAYTEENFRWVSVFYDITVFPIRYVRRKIAKEAGKGQKKILDAACGTGEQSAAFADEEHEVVGVDLSEHMLAKARKKKKPHHRLSFLRCDATDLPFKNGRFDISCVSMALHDMPEAIAIQVLKEMKRVTKKGGKIIILEYGTDKRKLMNRLFPFIARAYETQYYTSFLGKGLGEYLRKAGLKKRSPQRAFLGILEKVECVV